MRHGHKGHVLPLFVMGGLSSPASHSTRPHQPCLGCAYDEWESTTKLCIGASVLTEYCRSQRFICWSAFLSGMQRPGGEHVEMSLPREGNSAGRELRPREKAGKPREYARETRRRWECRAQHRWAPEQGLHRAWRCHGEWAGVYGGGKSLSIR